MLFHSWLPRSQVAFGGTIVVAVSFWRACGMMRKAPTGCKVLMRCTLNESWSSQQFIDHDWAGRAATTPPFI